MNIWDRFPFPEKWRLRENAERKTGKLTNTHADKSRGINLLDMRNSNHTLKYDFDKF